MSDTAQTIVQTGASVIAAPISAAKLLSEGVDPGKIIQVTGRDGQILKFKGFTVQPVLGRHGEPNLAPGTGAFRKAYADAYPATAEEKAAEDVIGAKGSRDPHILDQGMIAFIITFDDGFRLAWRGTRRLHGRRL